MPNISTVPQKLSTANQQDYPFIPTRNLVGEMLRDDTFPYEVRVSAGPLLRLLRESHDVSEAELAQMVNQQELDSLLQSLTEDNLRWKAEPDASLHKLFSFMFPSSIHKQVIGLVSTPFAGAPLYATAELRRVFLEGRLETPIAPILEKEKNSWRILEAGIHILNRCYDQEIDTLPKPTITSIDPETKLERYFNLHLVLSPTDVKILKPTSLTAQQIQELLNSLDQPELWLKYLPPENFAFEGLVFAEMIEVTQVEISSQLKAGILTHDTNPNPATLMELLRRSLRSYLGMPTVVAGLITDAMPGSDTVPPIMGLLAGAGMPTHQLLETGKYYQQVLTTGKFLAVSDLMEEENPGPVERAMMEKGYRNLLLLPLVSASGKTMGLLELGAREPSLLNGTHAIRLAGISSLISFGVQRAIQSLDQRVDLVIQQQFTSIHPSVAWKFREIASRYFLGLAGGENGQVVEDIVFRDVHPLYGQADIVGSSTTRNRAIQADLILNLGLVVALLQSCRVQVKYPLMDVYSLKAEQYLAELSGGFISSHETAVVELLNGEIHPFLREICQTQEAAFSDGVTAYFAELDPELNIIYRKRKAYEESVALLNRRISTLLEKGNDDLQKNLPHFFEHFKTDGVEYNLYVGASISPKFPFSDFQLKNVRIWQLVNMCEITRLVQNIQTELPVPLSTAQLVFVYNNALSIRFQMDEKRFDVDGAYNVRYEIIKKRIDKAIVKGKNERLTVKDKIAIVYLQEKDRKEYLEYLDYLLQRGYITDEIEDLELEKLQGVEGLRALRVTVQRSKASGV